jgi:plastocyanin
LAAVVVLGGLLSASATTPDREIRLIVRDMAFYLPGDAGGPNPVIEVRAGEKVRVVLVNQDRGMRHDFAVPAASAETALLRWNESGEVVFDAPAVPGTYAYVCLPHQLMMRGIIRVVE